MVTLATEKARRITKPRKRSPRSQEAMILKALQKGETITAIDALNRFDCLRLSARIWVLRAEGHPIETTYISTLTGKIIAGYKYRKEI